jgi:hypothetical protein
LVSKKNAEKYDEKMREGIEKNIRIKNNAKKNVDP